MKQPSTFVAHSLGVCPLLLLILCVASFPLATCNQWTLPGPQILQKPPAKWNVRQSPHADADDVGHARNEESKCTNGSQTDCSLNGECVNGACHCDPGWRGEKCNFLNLQPPDKTGKFGYRNDSMPTWSGNVIYEAGRYHFFVTAKADNTPPNNASDHYMCNTKIVRLSSEFIDGPFVYEEDVLPLYHHEVHAIRSPDNMVLLYVIVFRGGVYPGPISGGCKPPPHGRPYNSSHEVIALAWSESVKGPWKERVIFNDWPGPSDRQSWHCQTNCPSVTFTPNGTVVMALRALQCQSSKSYDTRTSIAIVTAPHWSANYTLLSPEPIFYPRTPMTWPISLVDPSNQTMANEDPFIWRNSRGYHILTHSQVLPHKETRGAYGFSEDGLSWTILPDRMWDTNMTWSDGSISYFQRRQAPSMIFSADGTPMYLITPVDETSNVGWLWRKGWTLFQPIHP